MTMFLHLRIFSIFGLLFILAYFWIHTHIPLVCFEIKDIFRIESFVGKACSQQASLT